MRIVLLSFLQCLLIASFVAATGVRVCNAQLSSGAIVTPEIFEELYNIDPAGSATDILDSPQLQQVAGDHLAIADASTAYLVELGDLYRFNFSTGQLAFVDQMSFFPLEITMDNTGGLIGVDASELFRINPQTGAESSLYTETFFSPSDAVADDAGNVYVTEFFDALGVLTPGGSFNKIGNFSINKFNHVDLGPDGMLYLSTNVGESFYRVDPSTGAGVQLDSDVFTFIDDLQVDAAGDIVFSGVVDFASGVFRFNPTTKAVTPIVDDSTINDGFFDPLDVAIFDDGQQFASADFDQDGDVDSDDLAHLRAHYGAGAGGDVDDDGDTDGADLLAWQNQFTGSANLATAAVPEPSSAVVLVACLAVAACHRGDRG